VYELNLPTALTMFGGAVDERLIENYVRAQAFQGGQPLRLHLGCGTVRLEGWVNIDIDGQPDLVLDLRFGLPFADGSVDRIHSEHMLEHFSLADSQLLMTEACRVLRPGGVIRIGMPDLEDVIKRYTAPDWRNQPWIQDQNFDWIDTPVALINVAFRGWEHRYLYDENELRHRLSEAGFREVRRVRWGESSHDDLAGLETRPETDLIVEAVR
jgi:predicted SAM-dependent methyltransferase